MGVSFSGPAVVAAWPVGSVPVVHGDEVYEGCIVGENSRPEDLVCNPTKKKVQTNHRAAGKAGAPQARGCARAPGASTIATVTSSPPTPLAAASEP